MNFGSLTIIVAFLSTIISAFYYYKASRFSLQTTKSKKLKVQSKDLQYARTSYYIVVGLITLASGFLFYLFITHQFQYKYVYGYSSKDLPFGFLISSFWAGQEGSFLFWTLMISWLGVLFLRKSKQFEYHSMLFLNIIQGFFLVILIKASPFATLSQTPPDGAGLNPLLQNFWMVIHPPVLFVGYAAATFAFALALSALIQRDFDGWIKQAIPWTGFTSLTLGMGIILGAFWAYETLGWGGYWGWDPVENSSLIPWLTTLALLHGLLVQNTKRSLKKTNFLLAIITFLLIIYATFLTRSGILSDFSVHSFTNLGINSFLVIFMITILISGFGIYLLRHKEIPAIPIDKSAANRENGLWVSVYIFIASAFLIFLGTSSPILTGLVGNPQNVETSFYNKVNLPVAILMALFLGIIPFLTWVEKKSLAVLRRFIPSIILSILSVASAIYLGITKMVLIIFITTSAFAFWTNLIVVFQNWKKGWHLTGAPLSHIGVGIIMISIIVSGTFDQSERIVLEKDKTHLAMGYHLTYQGLIKKADGKDVVNIEVNGDNRQFLAQPRLFYSPQNRGMMREPHVDPGILEDIYISPLERHQSEQPSTGQTIILVKGQTKEINGYSISFQSFHMSSHADGSGAITIGAALEVKKGEKKINLSPHLVMLGQRRSSEPLPIAFDDQNEGIIPTVALSAVNADDKSIQLLLNGLENNAEIKKVRPEKLIVEISKKPFMNILWSGTVILLVGTFISLQRRILHEKQLK